MSKPDNKDGKPKAKSFKQRKLERLLKKKAREAERRGRLLEGEGSKERSLAGLAMAQMETRKGQRRRKKTIEDAAKSAASKKKGRRRKVRPPKKIIYKGFVMDSAAELAFARLLDEFGVKWVKNSTQKFPYVNSSGRNANYIPDFYLEEYDEWVEIKGRYYATRNLKAQLDAVGSNIELIYSDEIRLPECCAHLREEQKNDKLLK